MGTQDRTGPEWIAGELDGESGLVLWVLLLLSVCIVTGGLLGAALLLPDTVGALISGEALLGIGMTFAAGGLALVTAIPDVSESDTGRPIDTERLRAVHREIDRGVLYPAALITVFGIGSTVLWPDAAAVWVQRLETFILVIGRPVLHAAVFLFVLALAWLAIGESGRVRFGGPDATPEYSNPAYLAMLFSAGIAAGIVFWGPAEALFHYDTVPPFLDAQSQSDGAVVGALQYTLFHWGISAWSAYLVVGLPIAYAVYNRGTPLRVSAMLGPVLGPDVVDRPVGTFVDVIAVLATLGGLATTLGFLGSQVLMGITFRWPVELGSGTEGLFIVGLTAILIVSILAGVGRGMRRLSLLNSGIFLLVLGGIAVLGPTGFVLERGGRALGRYVVEFVPMSLYTGSAPGGTGPPDGGWLGAWTSFYWAWWLSWAPFIGLFIASVSRGRQIRTVIGAAGVVTSVATMCWFIVVGGSALSLQQSGVADLLSAVGTDPAVAGYPLLEAIPFGNLLLMPFLLLIVTFFITSADAASRSLAQMTTPGDDPSRLLQVGMAVSIGLIAMTLIVVGSGGLVQSASVLTGGPFAAVGLVGIGGLVWRLRRGDQAK